MVILTAFGKRPNRLPKDPEARSLITGFAVALYYGVSSWSQILVWPAVEAPLCKSLFSSKTPANLLSGAQIQVKRIGGRMRTYTDTFYS